MTEHNHKYDERTLVSSKAKAKLTAARVHPVLFLLAISFSMSSGWFLKGIVVDNDIKLMGHFRSGGIAYSCQKIKQSPWSPL